MRNRYVVCYDVSDPDRCRTTYGLMQGYGDHIQYSVFLCELSATELTYLKRDLTETLNLGQDRAIIVDAGPADSDREKRFYTIGTQIISDREPAVVI